MIKTIITIIKSKNKNEIKSNKGSINVLVVDIG